MCLILFAFRAHPRFPLVLAANRDEFFARATAPAEQWPDAPGIIGGRDLEQSGTWMGVAPGARVAAITNFRSTATLKDPPSRGLLVSDFLRADSSPEAYMNALAKRAGDYNGFSLLVGDHDELWCLSNHDNRPRCVEPGVHGLSNHLLDTPWPKVEQGKARLSSIVQASGEAPDIDTLLALMSDDKVFPDSDLPDTGVGQDRERWLSPLFVRGPGYGTRASTVLLLDADCNVTFVERSFDSDGAVVGTRSLVLNAPT